MERCWESHLYCNFSLREGTRRARRGWADLDALNKSDLGVGPGIRSAAARVVQHLAKNKRTLKGLLF
jgi:hypothetical protein